MILRLQTSSPVLSCSSFFLIHTLIHFWHLSTHFRHLISLLFSFPLQLLCLCSSGYLICLCSVCEKITHLHASSSLFSSFHQPFLLLPFISLPLSLFVSLIISFSLNQLLALSHFFPNCNSAADSFSPFFFFTPSLPFFSSNDK